MQPKRSIKPWLVTLLVIAIIGLVLWFFLQKKQGGQQGENTAEQQAAAQAFEESKAQQRLANLEGIHLLITKYKNEHGSYPNQLSDLTDIKGYAPGVAKMISETKLDNGQPAYTYTKTDASYSLCANKVNAEPTCEGPKK
jgi:type II secretory pathway pseudopilin PulG